jgi:hypothetical protein
MTDLAIPLSATAGRAPTRSLRILAWGVLGGFALGAIARAWMRLIAEDPEFTWAGTIFIVAAFTIFGFAQSIAAVARRRATRRWTLTVARLIGAVGFMPLFIGAGALMLPTVVGGGFALARTDWRPFLRVICLLAAAGPVVLVGSQLVGSFGWSVHTLAGFLAMLAIYGTIIISTRFTMSARADGRRLNGRVRVAILVILGLVLAYALVGLAG